MSPGPPRSGDAPRATGALAAIGTLGPLGASGARGADREHLEAEADVARSRLARTLDALDRRRHELVDVRLQLGRHSRGLLLLVGVGLLALGGGVAASVLRRRARLRAMPAVTKAGPRAGVTVYVVRAEPWAARFFGALGRRVAIGVLGWGALVLAKRALARVAPPAGASPT